MYGNDCSSFCRNRISNWKIERLQLTTVRPQRIKIQCDVLMTPIAKWPITIKSDEVVVARNRTVQSNAGVNKITGCNVHVARFRIMGEELGACDRFAFFNSQGVTNTYTLSIQKTSSGNRHRSEFERSHYNAMTSRNVIMKIQRMPSDCTYFSYSTKVRAFLPKWSSIQFIIGVEGIGAGGGGACSCHMHPPQQLTPLIMCKQRRIYWHSKQSRIEYQLIWMCMVMSLLNFK